MLILKSIWDKNKNVRGHLWVLHWRFSRVSPRQGCPPFRANISMVRSRLWTPPPQLWLHSLHRLNSVHLQSIGDPKSQVAVVKIFIDINLISKNTHCSKIRNKAQIIFFWWSATSVRMQLPRKKYTSKTVDFSQLRLLSFYFFPVFRAL